MNTLPLASSPASNPSRIELGILLVALLAMYIPTYISLDQSVWNVVGQGHGPVMLALTLWLAWQRWPALTALPNHYANVTGGCMLLLGALLYIVGHSQDLLAFETASQIPALAGLLLIYKGGAILFMVPLPGSVVDVATGPLKAAVSYVAEAALYHLGYPIGRSGVTLTIGQYRLLVADACAGLNSIFALEAIGVFYMSVAQHTNQLRNIALATLIIPISFVSNVTRVMVLVLVTYYFGDEAGQGFVHGFAGILLFMVATGLTISTDSLLGLFIKNTDTAPQPVPAS
ncbi:MAG: exosortase B [Pseudomonadota bacterium]